MGDELIDVLNDRMEVVGQAPRSEAHAKGLWHRAFHCWIVSRDLSGESFVLFQLRSKDKDLVPNSLDISAAGHLRAGESPEDGLRELEEELGVTVTGDKLDFLGVHVEVYCDDKHVNREFDYTYLLREDRDLLDYRVQPSEVTGLSKISVKDGIDLFAGRVDSIECQSVVFDDAGRPETPIFSQKLQIASFAGGVRNNYFIKIFLLVDRYFAGDELLFI